MLTDHQIRELHLKSAKSETDFALVYGHCVIVEAIAMQLLDTRPINGIDRELVHIGCLLHDIGAYEVLENGIFVQGVRHGVLGEAILKEVGLPEAVWRIASHHTGVGLTAQDVIDQKLPIPVADYTPLNNEECLVTYADKFHTKGIPEPYFCTYGQYRKSLEKFGIKMVKRFDALAERFGKPDLQALAREFGHAIRDA